MLKTAFIGNKNAFDNKICEWLSQHTDLQFIVWTNGLSWSSGRNTNSMRKMIARFTKRARGKNGVMRTFNEILYFGIYRALFARLEQQRLRDLVNSVDFDPQKPLSQITQCRPDSIDSEELISLLKSKEIDAMFAMCIDVYVPKNVFEIPRLGTYLWHEGITPEYRGVHSPFWALAKQDYDKLGYTLLKMNAKLDGGSVFVQGNVENVDISNDWHCYIGHKAILDSLPDVEVFLKELEKGREHSIDRSDAREGYFSYPTGSELVKIMIRRTIAKILGRPLKSSPLLSEESG